MYYETQVKGLRVFFLDYYIPSNRYIDDSFSRIILDLKDGYETAIRFFVEKMDSIIDDIVGYKPYTIVPVPPSSANKQAKGRSENEKSLDDLLVLMGLEKWGIGELVNMLCERNSSIRINGTGCLVRTKSIEPSHKRRNRKEMEHWMTIHLDYACKHLIQRRVVLLVDDIVTTGSTMRVCRDKLKIQGEAREVFCFALGKTKV